MATMPAAEARRSDRRSHRVEVTLLGKSAGLEYEEPAHTVDVSDHGLRILTDNPVDPARSLNSGRIVYLFGIGDSRLGYYRIVWAKADQEGSPTWAGLEYLN